MVISKVRPNSAECKKMLTIAVTFQNHIALIALRCLVKCKLKGCFKCGLKDFMAILGDLKKRLLVVVICIGYTIVECRINQ